MVERFELKFCRQRYAIGERFPLSVCFFGVLAVSDLVYYDVLNRNLNVFAFLDAKCSNWITVKASTTWATSNGTWRDVCFWCIWYVTSACGKAYLHREKLNISFIWILRGILKTIHFFISGRLVHSSISIRGLDFLVDQRNHFAGFGTRGSLLFVPEFFDDC